MNRYLLVLCMCLFSCVASARDDQVGDGDEVILRRLFPKARRMEAGVDFGYVLNPAFVETTLVQVSGRYFFSEVWGVGVSLGMAQTKDRHERACVESFYNDPDHELDAVCSSDDKSDQLATATSANLGPAYAPIRELRQMFTVYGDYTLAYGKQILLLGATSHFDLRLRFGAGVSMADVYDERTTVRGHPERSTRGTMPAEGSGAIPPGVGADERDADGHLLYGIEGRDAPRRESTPHIYLGVAEELLLFRRFYVEGELATYALFGTKEGLKAFLLARLGMGVRF